MNSLIINTSNKVLQIVVSVGGKVKTITSQQSAKHNEVLIPLLTTLLKKSKIQLKDIDNLGVVVGPGSFTGIRVGIATIKAFKDALQIPAKGINNLDYLFNLAQSQYKDFGAVAIAGSADSYFVAKKINGIVYKFDRNLTLQELNNYAEGKPVVMFEKDAKLNSVQVELDENVLLQCMLDSSDTTLTPVYYQLSQAEREKLTKLQKTTRLAKTKDVNAVVELEKSIAVNSIPEQEIKSMLANKTYTTYVAEMDKEVVGMIILQLTDEVNIVSLAVKKQYRNLGIASLLIAKAQEFARKKKISNISIEVKYDNIPAYLLYTKQGFKLRRTRKAYYDDGADCLELYKQI